MQLHHETREHIRQSMFLQHSGVWGLVDGQFGSTGKGLAAAVLAEATNGVADAVISNAGPNSGHTFYDKDGEKVVLQQLPSYAIASLRHNGFLPRICMTAGAIIDPERFNGEVRAYLGGVRYRYVEVDPFAAVVDSSAVERERHLKEAVGSTGKGTGGALANKVLRSNHAVVKNMSDPQLLARVVKPVFEDTDAIFMEVSQGYSLGIDAGFYPYSTSRNCTVMQGMSDAGLHPMAYAGAMMVVRTFPIRVGGNSGPGYPDQKEIGWGDIGVEPERTTVTNKIRRVFTFSELQFAEALRANRPCSLFVNFLNYLPAGSRPLFMKEILRIYRETLGRGPRLVLLGYGPHNCDVRITGAE